MPTFDLDRYRAELDDVLLNGSPKKLRKFMRQHGMLPPTPDVMEVVFHKTISASTSLPKHYRRQSKQWLEAHHYTSWDDGDL